MGFDTIEINLGKRNSELLIQSVRFKTALNVPENIDFGIISNRFLAPESPVPYWVLDQRGKVLEGKTCSTTCIAFSKSTPISWPFVKIIEVLNFHPFINLRDNVFCPSVQIMSLKKSLEWT